MLQDNQRWALVVQTDFVERGQDRQLGVEGAKPRLEHGLQLGAQRLGDLLVGDVGGYAGDLRRDVRRLPKEDLLVHSLEDARRLARMVLQRGLYLAELPGADRREPR